MTKVTALLAGSWDFVVGDDWRTALGVGLTLGLIAALVEAGVSAWWVMPVAVLTLLGLSVRRAARSAMRRG